MAVFADWEPRAAKGIGKGWFGNDCNKRNCWPGNATKRASAFRQEIERIEKKEIALPLLCAKPGWQPLEEGSPVPGGEQETTLQRAAHHGATNKQNRSSDAVPRDTRFRALKRMKNILPSNHGFDAIPGKK